MILNNYLSNIRNLYEASFNTSNGFGVTAAVWEGASNAVSDNIKDINNLYIQITI